MTISNEGEARNQNRTTTGMAWLAHQGYLNSVKQRAI